MSDRTLLFFLACAVVLLAAVTGYQQLVFRRSIQDRLKKISEKLADILEKDSDEKVMIFTDHQVLMDLSAQINRMLLDRQKIKRDYRRQEIAVRKMLANISHDIRTPLTVVLGCLEILRLERKDDEMLKKAEAKAGQVVELINQFFTLAKLEAGDMDLEITGLDISELCRENVLGFYELLLQKEFTVELSIPEQKLFVQGEKKSLDRIFNNLLSNAIRYGSDGKYIGVFLREEENYILVDVVDRGRGIDRECAKYVFDRLYTMDDSRSFQNQGNGLGLAISKNLAVQMGGDLLLESEPGVKTVFTLRLKKFPYEMRSERNS